MKQSSIEQIFSHIKASRNDIKYWNDSMLVDWLLEQEHRYKALHKQEIIEAHGVKESYGAEGSRNLWHQTTGEEFYKEQYERQDNKH